MTYTCLLRYLMADGLYLSDLDLPASVHCALHHVGGAGRLVVEGVAEQG